MELSLHRNTHSIYIHLNPRKIEKERFTAALSPIHAKLINDILPYLSQNNEFNLLLRDWYWQQKDWMNHFQFEI